MAVDDSSPEKQLLDKLLAERAEIDQHIAFLQKRLGIASSNEPPSTPMQALATFGIQKGEFFGMSRAEATVVLLRKVRRTLSTNEIFQALEESGLDMSGKNVLSALYTSLARHGDLRKVARNTWGLKEWYPHLKDKKKNGSPPSENAPVEENQIQEELGQE